MSQLTAPASNGPFRRVRRSATGARGSTLLELPLGAPITVAARRHRSPATAPVPLSSARNGLCMPRCGEREVGPLARAPSPAGVSHITLSRLDNGRSQQVYRAPGLAQPRSRSALGPRSASARPSRSRCDRPAGRQCTGSGCLVYGPRCAIACAWGSAVAIAFDRPGSGQRTGSGRLV